MTPRHFVWESLSSEHICFWSYKAVPCTLGFVQCKVNTWDNVSRRSVSHSASSNTVLNIVLSLDFVKIRDFEQCRECT
jgi:hypothetical protein